MGGFRPNRIAAGLAALIAIAGLFAGASADDGDAAVVTLRPGVNEIGWISAPMPISRLYDEIPGLDAVLHWDRRESEWVSLPRRPGRDAPLDAAVHGTALRLVIGGGEPVEWERPIRPARGTIQLRAGINFAPWGGRSGTPAWEALRGVGASLIGAARWNAELQAWEPLPAVPPGEGSGEAPALDRGGALWVAVTRDVNWLQPTYEPPNLAFGSGVSAEDRTRARENLDFVMQFSAERYGIQAEFSDLDIFIPHDFNSLDRMVRAAGIRYEPSLLQRFLNFGAWGGETLMFSAVGGIQAIAQVPSHTTWLHEYFHAIQYDLAGSASNARAAPRWLREGTAMRAESDQLIAAGAATWEEERRYYEHRAASSEVRGLSAAEEGIGNGEYALGWAAAERLAARAGGEALIEFWRLLPPDGAGGVQGSPETRWRRAFAGAFGLSPGEYYAEFRRWLAELEPNPPIPTPVPAPDPDAPALNGTIIPAPGGAAAIGIYADSPTGTGSKGSISADGSFVVQASSRGPHRLRVLLEGGCWTYVHEDGLVADPVGAERFYASVGGSDAISAAIPPGACRTTVAGRISAPDGAAVLDVFVGGRRAALGEQGRFEAILPLPDDDRIEVWFDDGCRFHGGLDGTAARGPSIVARNRDRVEVELRIPAELCPHRFSGTVAADPASPLPLSPPLPREAAICSRTACSHYVELRAGGRFDLATGGPGPYYIVFSFGPACTSVFNGDALSFPEHSIAAPSAVPLEPSDGIEVRLPAALPDRCTPDPQPRRDG